MYWVPVLEARWEDASERALVELKASARSEIRARVQLLHLKFVIEVCHMLDRLLHRKIGESILGEIPCPLSRQWIWFLDGSQVGEVIDADGGQDLGVRKRHSVMITRNVRHRNTLKAHWQPKSHPIVLHRHCVGSDQGPSHFFC
jgi:hypothetical protein